ncbi:MAG: AAA family ATPase [Puniceicoccales bacterium]|nr:AAA family ATPase [Puniceicoccales bacterium]
MKNKGTTIININKEKTMNDNDDTKNIEKIKNNMREFCDHWLVPGEDNHPGDEKNVERIGKIQDHHSYNLVDGKNKTDSGENSVDNGEKNDIGEKKNELTKKSIIMGNSFFSMNHPPRELILSPWLRAGSLGYIFGKRGSGKTWFAWDMAINISKGENFGPWKCEKPWKTLYVDGEMPIHSMQEQLRLLATPPFDNLMIMSHETVAENDNLILNLCDRDQQEKMLEICVQNEIRIIFLDNLSCLFAGMRENEADDWEKVSSWLQKFQRNKISVIILHHANRDGKDMRGTSRREGAASWILRVSKNGNKNEIKKGTFFTTSFDKNREDDGVPERNLDWSFVTENGKTRVTHTPTDTKILVYDLIADGVDSNADIAEELEITKGMVSRYATKLASEGQIKKLGNRYVLI